MGVGRVARTFPGIQCLYLGMMCLGVGVWGGMKGAALFSLTKKKVRKYSKRSTDVLFLTVM